MKVPSASSTFSQGDQVRHARFGVGSVLLDNGPTAVVRFAHGIEECEKESLDRFYSLSQAIEREMWDVPLEVINRVQAEAIQSANDAWGVFSRARIDLLPHQLWVCRQVNATWPMRWLVADDVGLGKTIEAGMILWPLLARGTVKRLLILCPASLVEQWHYRLRTMFDIRLTMYTPEADTLRTDFWGTHNQVVASLQTLRKDQNGRQQRLLESDPWDLLIIDEAHHLNADEQQGFTLGYRLVKQLLEERRVQSLLFFTGTPHRGKTFGFLALVQLLRPDLFDPREPLSQQLIALPQVMIRNNKYNVTDLIGSRLFRQPEVTTETYTYSAAEQRFYTMLTEFIVTGQAYASTLSQAEGSAVVLVLIAMQKLASSSVAAIRRAVKGRLTRIQEDRHKLQKLQDQVAQYEELEQTSSNDELARLEEQIVELSSAVQLMKNEEFYLKKLLDAAEAVQEETKINKILNVLEESVHDRSVLFFTEYKATQSLLMSALIKRFGEYCSTFINGDERADEVEMPNGQKQTWSERREIAAEKFNSGKVRFLISTEAGGEGIDLQEHCHTLIHVDLPWNPMRLHQRVGRLNRLGQTQRVEVLALHNPDTVESLIWDKLNNKLDRITVALGHVMDEPEDMQQLVLGMTSPTLFRALFSGARQVPRESLDQWFDQKTAQFGGQDVVQTVRDLIGNANKFDFQQVSDLLPQVDLPDMLPFLETALTLNGRKLREDENGLSFLTPNAWKNEPGIQVEYHGMLFDRRYRLSDAARRLLGVGHKVVDQALAQAKDWKGALATLPTDVLARPLTLFRIRDRVTGEAASARAVMVGIEINPHDLSGKLLLDWQVLRHLNDLPLRKVVMSKPSAKPAGVDAVRSTLAQAENTLQQHLDELDHGFRHPYWEVVAILWPLSVVE